MNALALLLALPTTTTPAPTLPQDALFAVHLAGGESMRARLQDNVWLRAGLDFMEDAMDGGQAEIGLPSLFECAAEIESVAAYVSADMTTLGIFLVEADAGIYSGALGMLRTALEEELGSGQDQGGLVSYDLAGQGWDGINGDWMQLVLIQRDDVLGAVLTGEGGDALAAAQAAIAGQGGEPGGFRVRSEMPGAHLALHLDLARVMGLALEESGEPMSTSMSTSMITELFSGLGPIGAAVRFGEGGAVDGIARTWFEEDSMWASMAGALSPYDPELLRWAPAGCASVQVMGCDMGALIDELLAMVADMDEEAEMVIEEGLAMVEQQLGMDVMADIVGYMDTGILTYLTSLPEFDLVEDADYVPDLGYLFASSDAEALEENLRSMVEAFGLMAMVEVEELAGGRLYSVPDAGLEGFSVAFVAGKGVIGLLMGDEAIDHTAEILDGGAPRSALDDQGMREGLARSRGTVGYSRMDAGMTRTMLELAVEGAGNDADLADWLDAMEGVIEVINEVSATSLTVRGRIR